MTLDTPSTSNAIHLLKAEVLSPDWRLSPKRNTNLRNAMITLSLFFNERRYAKGLVAIAKQILFHLDSDQNNQSGPMDLLKEIMAHIVTFYEQNNGKMSEKKICGHYLKQFQELNIPIKRFKDTPNNFALANSSLKQGVDQLQSLAPQFNTLSATQQVQALLTLQSLIAETKALKKFMTNPA